MEGMNYREVVQTILKNHAKNRSNSQTEVQLIFDTEHDRYQVLNIGWQDLTRVFGCIIYVEIKDGKIWIERDGTEIGVANELVEAGVPKLDISCSASKLYFLGRRDARPTRILSNLT